jgi:trigger factor
MSVQVENLEKNMAKLTVEVPAEELDKAIEKVYQKQKRNISVPGFRKGKVPRKMVERLYGAGVFYEDAANELIPQAYDDARAEADLEIVSRPRIEVTQLESGKPFVFTAEVAVKPEVKLGEYKGLEVTGTDVTVTDEEVEKRLKDEQEKNSRLVAVEDRAAEDGDTVTLDYAGTADGVAFAGGTAENQTLVIGSKTFIPGFEEQLIGMNIGDEKDIEVTFPEDYHAEDLKGKAAVFHCKLHNIQKKELPELNDEFAEDVSEFDTLEEYKADLRKSLEDAKKESALQNKKDQAASKAAENAEIDIPDLMVESQAEQMVDNFANQLRTQGMDINQYMQYTGQNAEAMVESMKPQAKQQIRTRLTLEKIAETENIEINDEAVEEELKKMAEAYGLEVDKIKEIMGDNERENIREDLKVRAAIDLLAENAVEVDEKKEEKTEE